MNPTNSSKKSPNGNCGCGKTASSKQPSDTVCKAKKPADLLMTDKSKPTKLITQNKSNQKQTKIIVKCNCGFPNNLFIRGEGIAELGWERGIAMKNINTDEWIWETDKPFTKVQFKIMLNDRQYEVGENHILEYGSQITLTPKF